MRQFETIETSGDVGIRAYGSDLESLFMNAAAGMYALITAAESVRDARSVEVAAESNSLEGLLVSWLNELIFQFDANGFIGRRTVIRELFLPEKAGDDPGVFRIRAAVLGEDFDLSRHQQRLLIKAATYHRLEIIRENASFRADIIFDI